MLYLSLILIASGLLLVVFPLFVKTEKRNYGSLGDRYVPNYDFETGESARETEISGGAVAAHYAGNIVLDERGFNADTEFERPSSLNEKNMPHAPEFSVLKELEDELIKPENVRPDTDLSEEREAQDMVLYEDSSSIIDYETGANTIDPSLVEYKKMKRIGKGSIEVVKDGINIIIGKSFYRFDFYKIDRVKMGANYIALFLKGSGVVRLLIFEEMTPRILGIKKSIENYFSVAG